MATTELLRMMGTQDWLRRAVCELYTSGREEEGGFLQ